MRRGVRALDTPLEVQGHGFAKRSAAPGSRRERSRLVGSRLWPTWSGRRWAGPIASRSYLRGSCSRTERYLRPRKTSVEKYRFDPRHSVGQGGQRWQRGLANDQGEFRCGRPAGDGNEICEPASVGRALRHDGHRNVQLRLLPRPHGAEADTESRAVAQGSSLMSR